MRVLHEFQLADDVVGTGLERRISRRGPHHADRRQVVAANMPGQVAAVGIPAAVGFGSRLESGAFAIVGQHAVRLEVLEISAVQVLGLFERTAREAHRLQRQRPARGLRQVSA